MVHHGLEPSLFLNQTGPSERPENSIPDQLTGIKCSHQGILEQRRISEGLE
jgi:hypothetical protein